MSGVRVVFCTWCQNVEIHRPGDAVLILFPHLKKAHVNGIPVDIADGICQGCRATRFAEFPKPSAEKTGETEPCKTIDSR